MLLSAGLRYPALKLGHQSSGQTGGKRERERERDSLIVSSQSAGRKERSAHILSVYLVTPLVRYQGRNQPLHDLTDNVVEVRSSKQYKQSIYLSGHNC